MKPTSRCQGQGIFIVDKLSQVAPFRSKAAIAQTPPVPIPKSKAKKEEHEEESGSEGE